MTYNMTYQQPVQIYQQQMQQLQNQQMQNQPVQIYQQQMQNQPVQMQNQPVQMQNPQQLQQMQQQYLHKTVTAREHLRNRQEVYTGSIGEEKFTHFVYDFENKLFTTKQIVSSKFRLIFFAEIIANIGDVIYEQNINQSPIEIVYAGDMISIANFDAPFQLYYHEGVGAWSHEICFARTMAGSKLGDGSVNYGAGRNGLGSKIVLFNSMFATVEIYNKETRRYGRIDYVLGFPYVHEVIEVDLPRSFTRLSWKNEPKYTPYTMDEFATSVRYAVDYTVRYGVSSEVKVFNYMTSTLPQKPTVSLSYDNVKKVGTISSEFDKFCFNEEATTEVNFNDPYVISNSEIYMYFLHCIKYNKSGFLYEKPNPPKLLETYNYYAGDNSTLDGASQTQRQPRRVRRPKLNKNAMFNPNVELGDEITKKVEMQKTLRSNLGNLDFTMKKKYDLEIRKSYAERLAEVVKQEKHDQLMTEFDLRTEFSAHTNKLVEKDISYIHETSRDREHRYNVWKKARLAELEEERVQKRIEEIRKMREEEQKMFDFRRSLKVQPITAVYVDPNDPFAEQPEPTKTSNIPEEILKIIEEEESENKNTTQAQAQTTEIDESLYYYNHKHTILQCAYIPQLYMKEYAEMLFNTKLSNGMCRSIKTPDIVLDIYSNYVEFRIRQNFGAKFTNAEVINYETSLPLFSHPLIHGFIVDEVSKNPVSVRGTGYSPYVHTIVNGIAGNTGMHLKMLTDVLGKMFGSSKMVTDSDDKDKSKGLLNAIKLASSCLLFVNGYDPHQEGQNKDHLTSINGFTSMTVNFEFDKEFIKKWRIIKMVNAAAKSTNLRKFIENFDESKTSVVKSSVAQGRMDTICIVCEGKSARAYCNVIKNISCGRDVGRIAVVPLQGKPKNDIDGNKSGIDRHIASMIKTMNLNFDYTYETQEQYMTLNYKKLYILTDPDPDGSHIKGLVLTVFLNNWPALLMYPGFINWIRIPLVRIKHTRTGQEFCYYTMSQMEKDNFVPDIDMIEEVDEVNGHKITAKNEKGISVKYFKGLATSEDVDVKDDFMYAHNIALQFDKTDLVILRLLFGADFAEFRKHVIAEVARINIEHKNAIVAHTENITFKEKIESGYPIIPANYQFFKDELLLHVKSLILTQMKLCKAKIENGKIKNALNPEVFNSGDAGSGDAGTDIQQIAQQTSMFAELKTEGKTPEEIRALYTDIIDEYIKNNPEQEIPKEFNVEIFKNSVFADYNRQSIQQNASMFLTCGPVIKYNIFDYIVEDYCEYASLSVTRAIPSFYDGLKDVQRKIVYNALSLKNQEKKVATFGSETAAKTEYHHGDTSMSAAIIQLAMAGSCKNHIPLMDGRGQFGSRSDIPGQARYLNVRKSKAVKHLIIHHALPIIKKKLIDNSVCEYEYIPMLLPIAVVNGFKGIGTGWSSEILPRKPSDVLWYMNYLRETHIACGNDTDKVVSKICEDNFELIPTWKNWHGDTFKFYKSKGQVSWLFAGKAMLLGTNIVEITCVPPNHWQFESYEEFLIKRHGKYSAKNKAGLIKNIDMQTSIDSCRIRVEFNVPTLDPYMKMFVELPVHYQQAQERFGQDYRVLEFMGLVYCISETNMNFYYDDIKIPVHFDSVYTYLLKFYQHTIKVYRKMIDHLIKEILERIKWLQDRIKYIDSGINPKDYADDNALEYFLNTLDIIYKNVKDLRVNQMTAKKKQEYMSELEKKLQELENMRKITPEDFYLKDLIALKSNMPEYF